MKLSKLSILCSLFAILCATVSAQKEITNDMLQAFRDSYKSVGADKALDNAVAANDPKILALNTESNVQFDTNFSHKINSKGITNQKGSGRCWLFSALNVLRAPMIAKNNLGSFTFSQSYCFFYDQLEKSNLFLQAIIDNARKPMDDRTVEWLFHNPMSDGGTFCGAIDIITKYGVVPAEVMPETYSANYTSTYSSLLKTKLREYGLTLRKLAAEGKNEKQLLAKKNEMLTVIYKMLVRSFGQPPQQFTYTLRDKDNKAISTKEYTPLSFYQEYVGKDLKSSYLMFMNDPSREMYKTYEIDLDRHTYDGTNWVFLNVPMEDIKQMAIASIKDSTMLYMSCDVGKCNDSKRGYSDPDIYNYGDIYGVDFPMNKAERISSFASSSTHAMSLMAVDLDANDKPIKWMVENSWGTSSGYNGYIVMSDRWLDEYLFRLVVEKQYVPEKLVELSKQKPTMLPAWDPLFSLEQ
ncbi:MAG: C1 family peptidase [Bacteroidaceae bacterium]|nr:C1 family peptidase [Bacteroidaceae bacterium]